MFNQAIHLVIEIHQQIGTIVIDKIQTSRGQNPLHKPPKDQLLVENHSPQVYFNTQIALGY